MWAFNHYPWVTDSVAAAKARLVQPAGRAYPAPSFEEEFEGLDGADATEGYDGKGLLLGKLMSIESVMPSSHLILCRPLFLLPAIPPSIRVFSNESTLRMRWPKYWSFLAFFWGP